jgi:hypothetical protein
MTRKIDESWWVKVLAAPIFFLISGIWLPFGIAGLIVCGLFFR